MFSSQLCSNHPIWDLISSTSLKLLPPPVFPLPASQKIKVNMAKRKQFIFGSLQLIIAVQQFHCLCFNRVAMFFSYTVYFLLHGLSLVQKQVYKQLTLAKFQPLFNILIFHIRKCDHMQVAQLLQRQALPSSPPPALWGMIADPAMLSFHSQTILELQQLGKQNVQNME